jgi:hypothetical protein
LRALSSQFQHSDSLLKFITTGEAEPVALKKASLDLIEMMLQYIANAESGCAQRRAVRPFAQECQSEISALLTQAEGLEKRSEELAARQRQGPAEAEGEKPILPKKKFKKYPATKHLPVTRSKLFEDRKMISKTAARKRMTHSQSAFVLAAPPNGAMDSARLL